MTMTKRLIPILAATITLSAPGLATPPVNVDFASLSARYSVYPSIDGAQQRIESVVPAGLPVETARARLAALGMQCSTARSAMFRCHYSTSVTVDALYIQPIVWVVTVHHEADAVRNVTVSVD